MSYSLAYQSCKVLLVSFSTRVPSFQSLSLSLSLYIYRYTLASPSIVALFFVGLSGQARKLEGPYRGTPCGMTWTKGERVSIGKGNKQRRFHKGPVYVSSMSDLSLG